MRRAPLPFLLAAALALPAAAAEKDTDKGHTELKKRRDRDAGGGDCGGPGEHGGIQGPVASGFFDADFATGRRACPRTEMGLGLQGGAAIDLPNFYGQLG